MRDRLRLHQLRKKSKREPRKYAILRAFMNRFGQVRGFKYQVKVGSRVSNRALKKLIVPYNE
jgi:hypothetical protein